MEPKIIIRLGSHAEKDYLLKTVKFLDGLIIGANLIEATPAATASLIVKVGGDKLLTPYYIDPMTYAFGTYAERKTGDVRSDLDWIKSDQKIPGTKRTRRDFKSSYRKLAETLGGVFKKAVDTGIAISAFRSQHSIRSASESVVSYQLNRIASELEKDEDFGQYAQDLPPPAAVFAPYFYVEPSASSAWIDTNLRLARATAEADAPVPAHAVICVDRSYLLDPVFMNTMKQSLPETGIDAVWFWFSRFQEDEASEDQLFAFRELVESLSQSIEVYNLHGGFFSLALSEYGLSGTSHGIGYGEQKDVIPVIGQSIPTVRYYLPDIYKRVGVPQVERCFDVLGIKKPKDFHEKVCSCIVCKGVVSRSLAEYSAFGEMRRSSPLAKRSAQTPAAAKRCRFHFLLNRLRERDEQKSAGIKLICDRMSKSLNKWGSHPSLGAQTKHLERWISALKPPE